MRTGPEKRRPLSPLWGPILGLGLTYAAELNGAWVLPKSVLAWGGAISVVLVSTLRLIFPPVTDRLQAARIAAFWQKLEVASVPLGMKKAVLPGVILLVILLYVLMGRT